jgi:bacteriorhodopsin
MQVRGGTMPNQEKLHAPSTPARHSGETETESWVFVAFCVASYVAIVFLVFLSSHAGQIVAG